MTKPKDCVPSECAGAAFERKHTGSTREEKEQQQYVQGPLPQRPLGVTVVQGPPKSGKTQWLIDWVTSKDVPDGVVRVIVFARLDDSMDALSRARKQGREVFSWQFVNLSDFRSRNPLAGVARRHIEIAFDDVERLLFDQLNVNGRIAAMTVTGDRCVRL